MGQDGHYGTGKNGSQGMSFSKVSGYEGKCVQDNHMGLMWEVKQGGDGTKGNEGLHDADDGYNWYSDTNNNGKAGYKNDDRDMCHGYDANSESTFCNTQAYVARVNAAGWCGHNDWRLPTREELRSIVDYSRYNPAIDKTYFPNTQGAGIGLRRRARTVIAKRGLSISTTAMTTATIRAMTTTCA